MIKMYFRANPHLLFLILFYSLFSVLSFLKSAYLKSNGIGFVSRPWSDIIINMYLFDWLSVLGFMLLIDFTINYSIKKKIGWILIYSIHLLFSLAFGFFISTLLILVRSISPATKSIYTFNIDTITQYYFSNMEYLFLIYFSITGICYAAYYFKLINKEKINRLRTENDYLVAQAQLLQYQIQPHFLFNVLNNVSSLIDIDVVKSKNMLADLREFLEQTLKFNQVKFISAKRELDLTDSFLRIVENKYSELEVIKKFNTEDLSFFLPPLILQPLVENALKHGYNGSRLTIEISLFIKEDNVSLSIINNGAPLRYSQNELFDKGIGLTNLFNRLKFYFGNTFTLRLYNDDSRTKVIANIEVPLIRKIGYFKKPH